jgi:hypothetical protein
MADELDQAIEDALTAGVANPKRVRGDMGEVETHSIPDLIALDKYRRGRARGNPLGHVKLTKLIPPGAD